VRTAGEPAGTLNAAPGPERCVRLIHLTDPHLTTLSNRRPGLREGKRWLSWLSWQTDRSRRHRRARLDALTGALAAERPDVWAVTGDLCQIGLPGEAAEARAWLDGLAPPHRVLLVPGNHDIFAPDSAGAIDRHWAPYLHVDASATGWPVVRRFGDVVLIGLNSAVVTPPLRAGGRLGHAMLERLEHALARHSGACRVVLIHHPVLPGACRPRKALDDVAELAPILERQGPAVVLHGHLHRNREWRLDATNGGKTRVYCTASASAAGRQGAASARLFDVARCGDGFRIEMHLMLLDAGDRLHAVTRERWECPG